MFGIIKPVPTDSLKKLKPAYALYQGGPWYKPIPHYDALHSLHLHTPGNYGPRFTTGIFDDGNTMVSVATVGMWFTNIRPALFIVSSYNGRQPLEAMFGMTIQHGKKTVSLITSPLTVVQRHTAHADLDVWAANTMNRFCSKIARNNTSKVKNWVQSMHDTPLSVMEVMNEYSELSMSLGANLSRHKMMPFSKSDFGSDIKRCAAVANFTYFDYLEMVSDTIDADPKPLRSVYRKMAFLLRSDIVKMPEFY